MMALCWVDRLLYSSRVPLKCMAFIVWLWSWYSAAGSDFPLADGVEIRSAMFASGTQSPVSSAKVGADCVSLEST